MNLVSKVQLFVIFGVLFGSSWVSAGPFRGFQVYAIPRDHADRSGNVYDIGLGEWGYQYRDQNLSQSEIFVRVKQDVKKS